ncbi:MAG TPA: tRNA (adenosine(37)-N6)-threonylcarbamoyltransferase complex ATPase subunit type 1 TsaE [Nocardioidaceae bacterium]|nr:tRNA (adenosine(37)-N6)-threonylcarbamoyltransferase complex ATPase subunit type 1 TsaE [Nocardioidaceae bacterium]
MTEQMVGGAVVVSEVGPDRAADVVAVVHAGFAARERLDPPSTATDETEESVAAALTEHGGLLAELDGRPVGALLLEPRGDLLAMRRVAVHPDAQRMGVAGALVGTAERVAQQRGYDGLRLAARAELPATIAFWRHLGYDELDREGPHLTMAKTLPVDLVARSADEARDAGRRLAAVLRAGDLVILSGDLGAGKTTFTQGLGAGLGVRGDVTSPTFVIARVHPSLVDGPALVHVDAYRLGGIDELDDLDLDTSLDEAVTVVEWGEGVAEGLADTRLEVTITRARGDEPTADDTDARHVRLVPVGARWIGSGLRAALT